MIFEDKIHSDDPTYKTYESIFFETYKKLNPETSQSSKTGIMTNIRNKIPYYKHTMPKVMAIAYHMVNVSEIEGRSESIENENVQIIRTKEVKYPYTIREKKFNRTEALKHVENIFKNYITNKNKNLIVLDVARYYEHLSK